MVGAGFLAGWLVDLLPYCRWRVRLAGESLFSAVGAAGERKVAQVWAHFDCCCSLHSFLLDYITLNNTCWLVVVLLLPRVDDDYVPNQMPSFYSPNTRFN